MATFLGDVSSSLLKHYAEQLSSIDVVFASRRAAIYFEEELSKITTIKPRLYTIDKWILSRYTKAKETTYPSKFVLIAKLYTIYSKHHSNSTLSEFYSFGSMLLSDFDMIDRYMVDPVAIYGNLSDTKELDFDLSLSDSARDAAIEFWQSFDKSSANRQQEQEFQGVWRSLLSIYVEFNKLLEDENIAYSGRVYRKVAEAAKCSNTTKRKTVFVGLNALSVSEKEIFKSMNSSGVAEFIWDYDSQWSLGDDNFVEAGYFIERNIKEFPLAHYFSTSINAPKDVAIEVLNTPSEALQAKVVGELLSTSGDLSKCAVILTDESMLLPLLHSIPPEIGDINISMGYPLTMSPAGRLLELLINLHSSYKNGYFRREAIEALMLHPYTISDSINDYIKSSDSFKYSSGELTELDSSMELLWSIAPLHSYLVTIYSTLLKRFESIKDKHFTKLVLESLSTVSQIYKSCGELPRELYLKLLRQVTADTRVDFEGVSGRGLQVLGILESRSLDFDRVIMLSLSDDNFPSSRPDNSYIPSALLTGFGMPTIIEKSAIWSYYFYRLLQRSKEVSLLYCNVADGLTTGEPSRYILQLEYGQRFDVKYRDISLPRINSLDEKSIEIKKTPQMISSLQNRTFSPSALSSYISCPLRFYFRYIEGLKPRDSKEQRIDALDFGNLVHHALEELYGNSQPNDALLDSIEGVVDTLLEKNLAHKLEGQEMNTQISRRGVIEMVRGVIKNDINDITLHSIIAHEQSFSIELNSMKVGGRVDRVDRLTDGSIRIVDYKTGSVDVDAPPIEEIFMPLSQEVSYNPQYKSYKEVMQVLIYSYIAYKHQRVDVTPQIFSVRGMVGGLSRPADITTGGASLSPINVEQYNAIELALGSLLSEITSKDVPFKQCRNGVSCTYCDYKPICGNRV